jgi:hypothetical protein
VFALEGWRTPEISEADQSVGMGHPAPIMGSCVQQQVRHVLSSVLSGTRRRGFLFTMRLSAAVATTGRERGVEPQDALRRDGATRVPLSSGAEVLRACLARQP